jgi:hypothetical protein
MPRHGWMVRSRSSAQTRSPVSTQRTTGSVARQSRHCRQQESPSCRQSPDRTVYKAFKPEADAAAQAAIDLINGKKPQSTSTVSGVPSVLLTPVAVTVDKIESTVVADALYKASEICTTQYAAACTTAGIK